MAVQHYPLSEIRNYVLQTFEPRHEISKDVVYATSNGSDQPAHTRNLARAFACRLNLL